jgi:N4-gp56 family major capsid protein
MKTIFERFNLQLFAEVNTTVNKTTDSALNPTIKSFYDTELLENARVEMYYAQFAKKQPLPAGNGKTVEWRKWNTFARANELEEGVIPTGQTFGMTNLTDSIHQYGTYATVSDVLELTAYDDIILGATEEMGASAAETQEILIRNALKTNMNVLYCDKGTGAAPTDASGLDKTCLLTPKMVAKAATQLKKNRVPKINGKYVAVIHPSVAHDLRQSEEWIEAHKYAGVTEIYNGEIGELHGVRFIENTFAPITNGDGNGKLAHYSTFFFGKDSFGIIDPEGGALEMIVKDKSQIGGPLNQFSTIGYKFMTNGAKILYPERLLNVMSCSSYSDVDVAN